MKKLFTTLSLSFFICSSFSYGQIIDGKEASPIIKEAIVSCLSTLPKNTDNKISRDLVKKCLETKGIQAQKTDSTTALSPLAQERKNEALKQCHSSLKSEDGLKNCLQSKGIQ